MKLTELHDKLAYLFNQLEHKEDLDNSNYLKGILEDLQKEIKQRDKALEALKNSNKELGFCIQKLIELDPNGDYDFQTCGEGIAVINKHKEG